MPGIDITDDPWTIFTRTQELKFNTPSFINIYTCRANWHVGIGTDESPEWDRFSLVKNELKEIGLTEKLEQIEKDTQAEMSNLWDKKQLQILLGK